MQGLKRKFVYDTLYEAIAIAVCSVALALWSGQGLWRAGALSAAASAVAVIWNLVFNTVFEAWESRQPVRGRGLARRVAHALGFEGGLVLFLVPLIAWWLQVGLWQALMMDLALLLFFLVYTFAFNWAFDQAFGLPASAR
jgi:uncharacterized membrane protein